jgi:hypothetical protein
MTHATSSELIGRLHHLRVLLPRVTAELAEVRRQAAALRVENRRLREELARLKGHRDREMAVRSLRMSRGGAARPGAGVGPR